MNELATQNSQLPETIEDLSRFVLIGRERLVAVKASIRAIEKAGLAKEVHEQKLKEAQEISEAVLDAEVRLGELTDAIPTASGERTDLQPMDSGVQRLKPKSEVLSELGISEKQKQRYEQMAKHPEAVETAKADARERGDIVTRQAVFDIIRKEKEVEDAPTPQPETPVEPLRKPERKQKVEDVVRERMAERQAEIDSGVVSMETLKAQKDDQRFLENSLDGEIWNEFRGICRALRKLVSRDREELLRAFKSTGLWGMHEKNWLRDQGLTLSWNNFFDDFQYLENIVKEVMEIE